MYLLKRTETNDMTSTHAAAAKQIRQEIKKHGIKARVTCDSYSGGDSVTVELCDELPATVKQIEEFAGQYKMGRFNGMTDCYEYSNTNADLPQVTFVFVNNRFSAGVREAAKEYVNARYELAASWDVDRMVNTILNGSEKSDFWAARKPRIAA